MYLACHHGMTRPRVADGGDGLQVCRVAATSDIRQGVVLQTEGWAVSQQLLIVKNSLLRNVTQDLGIRRPWV